MNQLLQKHSSGQGGAVFREAGEEQPAQRNAQPEFKVCCHCRKYLPIRDFYPTKDGHDYYCKSCRYEIGEMFAYSRCRKQEDYPVITLVDDPEVRLELVRNAHRKVMEMAVRSHHRRIEEESRRFYRNMKGGLYGTC